MWLRTRIIFKILLLLVVQYSLITEMMAQNWRTINSGTETYFDNNYYFNSHNLEATRFDSVVVIGQDTLYYNYKVIEDDLWGFCIGIEDTNWLGPFTIVRPDGWNIFFNQRMDSIRFNTLASLNDSWILLDLPDGGYLEATITAIDTTIIFGTVDSIKTILIQAKDSLDIVDTTHAYHNKTLILSKSYGFSKLFNLLRFPIAYFDGVITLVGMSNPDRGIINLTKNQIYDYDVGDEFHFSGGQEILGMMWSSNFRQNTILDKSFSLNQDTIFYTTHRQFYYETTYFNPYSFTRSYSEDTVSGSLVLSVESSVSNLPFEVWTLSSNTYGSGYSEMPLAPLYPSFNNRRRKITTPFYYYDSIQNCLDVPVGACIYNRVTYVEGLGRVSTSDNTSFECYEESLVYFKKGTETWGSPLDWVTILGGDELRKIKSKLQVFPNPASDILNVLVTGVDENASMWLSITDVQGREVLKSRLSNVPSVELNISALGSGVYILYYIENGVQKSGQKLVIQ